MNQGQAILFWLVSEHTMESKMPQYYLCLLGASITVVGHYGQLLVTKQKPKPKLHPSFEVPQCRSLLLSSWLLPWNQCCFPISYLSFSVVSRRSGLQFRFLICYYVSMTPSQAVLGLVILLVLSLAWQTSFCFYVAKYNKYFLWCCLCSFQE